MPNYLWANFIYTNCHFYSYILAFWVTFQSTHNFQNFFYGILDFRKDVLNWSFFLFIYFSNIIQFFLLNICVFWLVDLKGQFDFDFSASKASLILTFPKADIFSNFGIFSQVFGVKIFPSFRTSVILEKIR